MRAESKDFRSWTEAALDRELGERLRQMNTPSQEAVRQSELIWSRVAKPLGSLGLFEVAVTAIAGMTGESSVCLEKKAVLIFCADNGVVEEGVTQTGPQVTAAVTRSLTRGEGCICLMANSAGAEVFPVDIGVACPLGETGSVFPLLDRKIRKGTRNFLKEPALTRGETLAAILTGIDLVRSLSAQGCHIIATGEMGIGNTTTSSAAASVFLGVDPIEVTGKGAGLDSSSVRHKAEVIRRGIRLHSPDPADGIDVISKVGGLDLAGLTGVFLGGSIYRVPVVIDGLISAAAAAAAMAVDERAGGFMLASHLSAEPAGGRLLSYLGKQAPIQAGLCLGEGTGAVCLFPLLDMALAVYRNMITFSDMEIETYQPL